MRDVFALWPKRFEPGEMPYGCHICSSPCGEPGYVRIDANGPIVFCRCCIELLVETAPDIARDKLALTKTEGGQK